MAAIGSGSPGLRHNLRRSRRPIAANPPIG